MDTFFNASKVLGVLVTPSNTLIIVLVCALVASRFSWSRTWAIRVALFLASVLVALAVLPVGDGMLGILERRFSSLERCQDAERIAPTGVIVLGGAVGSIRIDSKFETTLGDASERVTYAASLARQYPTTNLIVSGGQAFEDGSGRTEAEGMADLLIQLGVPPERILREARSRTTAENAAFVAENTGFGRWLLVTSAFHMPRAVATFRKAGVDVVAAPTDWRVGDTSEPLLFSASGNLQKVDLATREYFGLLAYWLSGRTSELFPGPEEGRLCG